MGLLWDAFRESTSSPKDRILAAVAAFVLAGIAAAVCLWAFEGGEHVADDLNEALGSRSLRRRSRTLDGIALAGGFVALVFAAFGVLLLVIPGRKPQD